VVFRTPKGGRKPCPRRREELDLTVEGTTEPVAVYYQLTVRFRRVR
jgi:hypothetical protein